MAAFREGLSTYCAHKTYSLATNNRNYPRPVIGRAAMRGELGDKLTENLDQDAISVEKQQEILLMNKLASGGRLPPKTQSSFLQKKLQQRKYFDSGDYNMGKDKEKKHHKQLFNKPIPEGTPNISVNEPTTEIHEPEPANTASTQAVPPVNVVNEESDDEGHLEIPKPDTVPKRKASILHPSVHSKLSPTPLIHHDQQNDELSS
ncbi:CAMP-regulated phosphoprotein/endosulfine region [Aphelenchoides bicaudatus]|nr:CAMP-regulated phosphoprotein/endosulfine region [Aphelenchoides bicaudatus]